MDLGVTVPSRAVQDHGDPAQEQDLTSLMNDPDRLLEDLAGLDPSPRPSFADELPGQVAGMLADHEEGRTPGDPEDEAGRAEVAILDPEVVGPDQRQERLQERSLLSMT